MTSWSRPLRILLIDDDAVDRGLVRRLLEDAGHMIDEAGQWQEGVAAFFKNPHDVVLVDVKMPGVDGDYLVRSVKRGSRGRATAIILLSGLPEDDLARTAASCGADGYLHKPLSLLALRELVERFEAPGEARSAGGSG